MSAAALFRILVRNQVNVAGGPAAGTEYSLASACPACGTGAVQVGPLKLGRFKPPKAAVFSTLDDEILVAEALGETLAQRGLACLGPVVAKDGQPLRFRQLVPQAVLPAFSAAQTGFVRERPCPRCGRDGYFVAAPGVDAPLAYDAVPASLGGLDLLATFERFGNSRLRTPLRDSVFAAPLLVAGERLAGALREAAVKGLELHPVQVGASVPQAAGLAGRSR